MQQEHGFFLCRQEADHDTEDDAKVAVECTEASSTCKSQIRHRKCAEALPVSVSVLKLRANSSLQAGDLPAAVEGYTAAIKAAQEQIQDNRAFAALYSNRAYAHILARRFEEVRSDLEGSSCSPHGI